LRDQRDNAIRTLAEYFPLTTYYDGQGQFIVNIDGVGSLVSGVMVQELTTGSSIKNGLAASERGDTEVYFVNRPGVPMTEKIRNGTLGAQIKTRDIDIKSFESQLDEMAHGLVLATNAIHRQGFANHPVPVDGQGNPLPSLSKEKVTGINFFKEPIDLKRASEYIALSDEIESDSNNIATGILPNTPGDNRVALAISKLQHEKVLSAGNSTFEEHYLKSVGGIGLKTGKSKIDEEQSHGILAQAKSFKEKLAGVSLDEEAANMVRYQNAYEASAKVIKASDDMFKAVLGLLP
jgi:flagellar hook-associated protein 1 FlgK